MLQRRTFLKVGLAGGALLAAGGAASWLARRDAAADRREVLGAVIPAMLDGAVPAAEPQRQAAIEKTRVDVEAAIAALAPAAQDELAQLFALMAIAPTRLVLTGIARPWHEAGIAEVSAMLQSWRTHRLALLRGAYHGLHDLITAGWYADEARWAAIGYPGPPRL
jgi:hypothetical protein